MTPPHKNNITATKLQNTVKSHPATYSQRKKEPFHYHRMFCRGFMGPRGIVFKLSDRKILLHWQLNQSYILQPISSLNQTVSFINVNLKDPKLGSTPCLSHSYITCLVSTEVHPACHTVTSPVWCPPKYT
jgi:hypothetical protein